APTPPEDIDELCFELTIESAVEFCDGEICSSELELCLIVDPKFYCEMATTPAPPTLKPGDNVIIKTNCYSDGTEVECPILTWKVDGFQDANGQQNVSLAPLGRDARAILPNLASAYVLTTLPPNNYPKPNPYYSSDPYRKVLTMEVPPPPNNLPPHVLLVTYGDFLDKLTPPTVVGNVIANGTSPELERPFECSVYGSTEEHVVVKDIRLPDLEATFSVKCIQGCDPDDEDDEIQVITYGVKNVGDGETQKFFITRLDLEMAPPQFSILLTPSKFGPDEEKTRDYEFTCPHPGIFPFNVTADPMPPYPDGRIEEGLPGFETNNKKKAYVNCGGVLACPDLV
ncbi:MAG: hypothetical protein ABIH83_00310, partial [Candidatus Micrarchaeota archaeon]